MADPEIEGESSRRRPANFLATLSARIAEYRLLLAGGALLVITAGLLLLNVNSPSDSSFASQEIITYTSEDPTAEGSSIDGSPAPGRTALALDTATGKRVAGKVVKQGGISFLIPDGGGTPIADLYTAAEDRRGITDSEIRMCVHYPKALAQAIGIYEGSIRTYVDYVNEELGGIYGRRMAVKFVEDNAGNGPNAANDAYEECKAQDPFFISGPPGFDITPDVRALVEADHGMYWHDTAREDPSKRYSFSYKPSLETVGRRACQWILAKHAGKRIGAIWRNSSDWEPGHETLETCLRSAGSKIAVDLQVEQNQTLYNEEINELQDKTDIVVLGEDFINSRSFVEQSSQQNFKPNWLLLVSSLSSFYVEDSPTLDEPHKLEGIASWLPYMPGDRPTAASAYSPGKVDGTFAAYKEAIVEFERQHAKFARDEAGFEYNRTDLAFASWNHGWKIAHKGLLACGPDCTRNKFIGLLASKTFKFDPYVCPIDFTRDGHVGTVAVNVHRGFEEGGRYGWENIETCREGF